MDLPIDTSSLNALITKAIYDSMTAEKREELVQKAIHAALYEPTDTYQKKSRVQMAFEEAVGKVARAEAEKLISEDKAFANRVRDLLHDASNRVFGSPARREKLLEDLSNNMHYALTRRD